MGYLGIQHDLQKPGLIWHKPWTLQANSETVTLSTCFLASPNLPKDGTILYHDRVGPPYLVTVASKNRIHGGSSLLVALRKYFPRGQRQESWK